MSKTHFKTLSLISLAAALYGCQPDTPAQQAAQQAAVPTPVVTASEPAPAVAAELQLAQAKKCMACHTVDKKLVGPAWRDVAAKYRGQKGAEARLIEKVAKGGSGAWGPVPMPPNSPQVSDGEIKTLVRFILDLK